MSLKDSIENNNLAEVKQIVESGGHSVDGDLEGGRTPLVLACLKKHPLIVEYLIKKGADVNKGTKDHCYPIHYAAACEKKHMLKLLLQHPNIDVHVKCNGLTALHYAVLVYCTDNIRLLLQHPNIDRNIRDNHGRTAYDCAKDDALKRIFGEVTQEQQRQQQAASKQQEIAKHKSEIERLSQKFQSLETGEFDENINKVQTQLNKIRADMGAKKEQIVNLNSEYVKLAEQELILQQKLDKLHKDKNRCLPDKQGQKNPSNKKGECPICLEVMLRPRKILQCRMGHPICSGCRKDITHCPICREELPQEDIRCLMFEQVINGE